LDSFRVVDFDFSNSNSDSNTVTVMHLKCHLEEQSSPNNTQL
jgi:hypothetical protein